MGIIDDIFGAFKRRPLTREGLEDRKGRLEEKRAEAMLRLESEKASVNPDLLKIDKYEREIKIWDTQLNRIDEEIKKLK